METTRSPEDHKPIQVTLAITGIRQKYIKQNKPVQYKTQLYDKQQLQQTIQSIQIMKQQLTQLNPNSDLRNPELEQLGAQFQANIQHKLQSSDYTQIHNTNEKQSKLNELIREATRETFPPKAKTPRKQWITTNTHNKITTTTMASN